MKKIDGGVCAPIGYKAAGIHCGIRKNKNRKDLSLIVSDVMCHASSTYTLNKVQGAPIAITKKHLINNEAKAIICNSGNANTCNSNGEEIAIKTCEICAKALNVEPQDIIIASTGVIGQPLSIQPFEDNMDQLVEALNDNGSQAACEGIMTTDTVIKEIAVEFELDGTLCRIGGIAKGSGMIHPNMATMLCFITTDVHITKELLDEIVKDVVNDTFNMVSVDGDTSTNDMVSVLANGLSQNKYIERKDKNYTIFKNALYTVLEELSKAIAKDGEGATKLLTCHVTNANTTTDAKIVAKSVITSSLFKAAMFGKDANWGRILCAIGYSEASYDVNKIDVVLSSTKGTLPVCKDGKGIDFDEDYALVVLEEDEIIIDINLNDGSAKATSWGCDLTYDYVKINGDYRT